MAAQSYTDMSTIPPGHEPCLVCGSCFPIEQLIQVGCANEHHYCEVCLQEHFAFHTSSVLEYPPRCCDKELHPHDYLQILSTPTIRECIRLSIIQENARRPACTTPKCAGPGIDPINVHNDWALCERCLQLTCARCGQSETAHHHHQQPDHNVPKEATNNTPASTLPATDIFGIPIQIPIQQASAVRGTCPPSPPPNEELETAAAQNKWTRCPACNLLVDRMDGCNEMKCICGETFCYACGGSRQQDDRCDCMSPEEEY